MKKGKVFSRLWSSKCIEGFPSGALLEVKLENTEEIIVAYDLLSCAEGETVLVATGSVAQKISNKPVDAVIVSSIEEA